MTNEIRYYTEYLDCWFAIAGTDEDPSVTFIGKKKPNTSPDRIRKFKFLPADERDAVEACHTDNAVGELLAK